MFQQWYYNEISLPMPAKGMNKFLSPDVLPPDFSYHLENIIPSPVGEGQVRFGTNKINQIDGFNINIIEAFLFVKEDGTNQAVLYVQTYSQDNDVSDINIFDQKNFSFTSTNSARYIKDTYIQIDYTLNGSNYVFYPNIESVINIGDLVDITISENYFPQEVGDIVINNIGYSVGQIYYYDYSTDEFSDILLDNLSVSCIPRSTTFNQTLIICNGVDKLLSWDGDNLQEVYDFVKEVDAVNFARINNFNFSFTTLEGFEQQKYFDGNELKLSINGVVTNLTIYSTDYLGGLETITTNEILPAFTGADVIELFYKDWPPTFNYIYSGTDRLWALGPGPAGIGWREQDETLRVYYTFLSNTTTAWFNQQDKKVPFIDISSKHGIQDNLEAIAQVNGLTAFIGRSRTQVWSGSIPGEGNTLGNLGNFQWQANLDIGTVHGNLLIEMPNDVYFISQTGLKSASTLNVAKQFAATSFNAVDPLIDQFLSDIMSSDTNYRACRSFKYKQGKLAGFKFGSNKILVSLIETSLYAWTLFSGDFQKSNAFLDTGESLSLFILDTIYQYADGRDGSKITYGDNDGSSIVSFSWIPGLVNAGKNGFACKRYQLVLSYPSSFPLNDSNEIIISVNGDTPSTFNKSDVCEFEEKGDTIGSAPLMLDQTYQPGYFKLNRDYSFLVKRFKFASSRFWVMVNGYAVNGPIYFREIKLFGS